MALHILPILGGAGVLTLGYLAWKKHQADVVPVAPPPSSPSAPAYVPPATVTPSNPGATDQPGVPGGYASYLDDQPTYANPNDDQSYTPYVPSTPIYSPSGQAVGDDFTNNGSDPGMYAGTTTEDNGSSIADVPFYNPIAAAGDVYNQVSDWFSGDDSTSGVGSEHSIRKRHRARVMAGIRS